MMRLNTTIAVCCHYHAEESIAPPTMHVILSTLAIANESWNSIMMQYHEQTGLELSDKGILDTGKRLGDKQANIRPGVVPNIAGC